MTMGCIEAGDQVAEYKQTVKKWRPGKECKFWQLVCFRDGRVIMRLEFSQEKDADWIANYWISGANMGTVAEVMKATGMRF